MALDGDPIWSLHDLPYLPPTTSACLTSNGIACLSPEMNVVLIDSFGSWLTTLVAGEPDDEGWDIMNTSRGFLISGSLTNRFDSASFILEIDFQGNTIWRREFPHMSEMNYIARIDTYPDGNGYAFVSTSYGRYPFFPSQIFVARLDNNGCTLFDKIDLTSNRSILHNVFDTVVLTAQQGFMEYVWSFSDTTTTNQVDVQSPGYYWVKPSELRCATSDTVTVSAGYCLSPDGLSATNLHVSRVSLSWRLNVLPNSTVLRGNQLGNPNPIQISINSPGASSFVVNNLRSNTSYWWQVKQVCAFIGDTSEWSAIDTFITPDCSEPDSIQSLILGPTSGTLEWLSASFAESYELRGKPINSATWINLSFPGHRTSLSTNQLDSNTTYHWQIRTVCDQSQSVFSPWSRLDTFTTPQFRLVGAVELESLVLIPNMIGEQVSDLRLIGLGEIGNANISCYSLEGHPIDLQIYEIDNNAISISFNSQLANGVYLLQVEDEKGTETLRFMVTQ